LSYGQPIQQPACFSNSPADQTAAAAAACRLISTTVVAVESQNCIPRLIQEMQPCDSANKHTDATSSHDSIAQYRLYHPQPAQHI
jgi:hypothetical protein